MFHQPVLLHETIDNLDLQLGETVVDGTLGNGGHAKEICQKIGSTGQLIGLDQDEEAIIISRQVLVNCPARKTLIKANFRTIKDVLSQLGIETIDAFLLDLGFNSNQLDSSGRGFSFQKDEPLLMTFNNEIDPSLLSAGDIINHWSEKDIANVLYGYGEERYSRRLARAIVEERRLRPFSTTGQLVELIIQTVPAVYRRRKIHPATRTFQALRIAVNDELGAIREGLAGGWEVLRSGGRLAVISFHSLEARIVKEFFQQQKRDSTGQILTKKVIKPQVEEIERNPRARSAQLRIIKKL